MAFANNEDYSFQLGRIILLVDKDKKASIVSYRSYKSRRVTRSVSVAEVSTFTDLFDEEFALKKTVELALNRRLLLHLLTDSKSLFGIISKGSRTNKKRLMPDIYAARKGYKARDISNIVLCPFAI